jgi:hypothetical protein
MRKGRQQAIGPRDNIRGTGYRGQQRGIAVIARDRKGKPNSKTFNTEEKRKQRNLSTGKGEIRPKLLRFGGGRVFL